VENVEVTAVPKVMDEVIACDCQGLAGHCERDGLGSNCIVAAIGGESHC